MIPWHRTVLIGAVLFFMLCVVASFVLAAGSLQVKLTWMNPDHTNQIQLEKGPTSTGPFVFLAMLDPETTSYLDTTNTAGTKACYRMAYYSGANLGPYTTPKCHTFPLTPVTKPGSLTIQ